MRVVAFLVFALLASVVNASSSCEADLNGDGICDPYGVRPLEDDGTISRITIDIGGGNKSVSGVFELGDGGLSVGYLPGELSLLLDFYTRNINLTQYSFKWDSAREDWVLYKISTWAEPSRDEKYTLGGERVPVEELFSQKFNVQRVACCTLFSQFSENRPDFSYLSNEDQLAEIRKDFKYILGKLPQGEKGELFYGLDDSGNKVRRSIPQELVYELTLIISNNNVGPLNDYAYYLYRSKNNVLAALLLREIHKKFPERVVATLNLADAYWDIGMKSDACPLYKEYIAKMTDSGKGERIPQSAESRENCN
jgi:hypothetical protein